MKRREFLLLSGAAAGSAAMNPFGCDTPVGAGAPYPVEPVLPGEESFVSTTCMMCPGACGLRVRRVDGVPVGIRGNPNHPLNAGGVCPEGTAALQLLYHPDRLLHPMRRRGSKGSREFAPVTWDEALNEIVGAMRSLRERGKPEKLAFVLGRARGSMEDLVRHFLRTWGSPRLLMDRPQDGQEQVFETMHGMRARPAFHFDEASIILSFGADLLGAWESPVQFQRSYAAFREPGRVAPGSLVVADVRFSETAARAQEWVAIRPGSHGALAMGIAYVMVRERLYDEAFVEDHLYGFEDVEDGSGTVRPGYRSLVLRNYSPEVVSQLTGVSVDRVLALGKSFGETPGALAVFGESVTAQPGGLYAAMAVHSLNLLKGNINRPGGVYLQPETPLSPVAPAASGQGETGRALIAEDLADLVASPDAPEVVFLHHSNPLFSSPMRGALDEALKKVPLVVSFSPFMDETSHCVDLLLPDRLFLERWEDSRFPSASPFAGWGIVQPCAPPEGDTRQAGDVVLEIARRFGSPLEEAIPWETFEELLRHRARGLFETQAGTLCVDSFNQGLIAEMQRRGWWMPGTSSFEEFWEKLLETGAWTDPNFRVRTLREYSGHADGRIDLYSRVLAQKLAGVGVRPSEEDCLPHHAAPRETGASDKFPAVLVPYRAGRLWGGTSGTLPWMLQSAGALQESAWNSWVELHPDDARDLGIRDHDWVSIESAAGKVRVRAAIYAGTMRGVVNLPCGMGHTAMGRWAAGRGVNPLDLLAGRRDPLSGMPDRFGTRVRIQKA